MDCGHQTEFVADLMLFQTFALQLMNYFQFSRE